MFHKILSVIFGVIFFFSSFCAQRSVVNEDFQTHARAANYFVKVLGESTGVSISIICDGINVFDRRFAETEYNTLPDITKKDISLCKQNDNILCQIYSATKGVFFSFLFNLNGDIELSSSSSKETGIKQNTKFAFQTNRSIKNHNPISFYHLAVNCNDFYNYSVLQMRAYALFAKYYYNAG